MNLLISRSSFAIPILGLGMLTAPFQLHASELSDTEAKHFFNAKGCNACHGTYEIRIGPSYQIVAMRYEATLENVDRLAMKILFGGSGAWGTVPMISNPSIAPEEAQSLARWILKQNQSAPKSK